MHKKIYNIKKDWLFKYNLSNNLKQSKNISR